MRIANPISGVEQMKPNLNIANPIINPVFPKTQKHW